MCTKCNKGEIEDEMHFFIHCQTYNTYRQELCAKLRNTHKNLDQLNETKILFLLNNRSLVILKAVIEYINKCV